MPFVAWSRTCRSCELVGQEQRNVDPKAKGVKVFLRRPETVGSEDLDRLG